MRRYFPYILASLFLMTVIGSSCRDDEFTIPEERPNPLEGGIKVGAKISQPVGSRSYFTPGTSQSGPVVRGKFKLAYPYTYTWINTPEAYGKQFYFYYHYGEVNFGFAGEESTGFVNRGTPTNPLELTWSSSNSSSNEGIIYYPNKTTGSPMFLDNFPYPDPTKVSGTQLRDSIFSIPYPPDIPFVPGVYDLENGSNDLLWGTTKAFSPQDFIEFTLDHRMTRLQITVKVDNSDQDGYLTSIKNAKMWIEGLLLEPKSYVRKTGELRFEERATNSSLQPEINPELYNTEFLLVEGNPDAFIDNSGTEEGTEDDIEPGNPEEPGEEEPEETPAWARRTWASQPDDPEYTIQEYETKDFVFVPQNFNNRPLDVAWPRVYLMVPKQEVNSNVNPGYDNQNYIMYSGDIPRNWYWKEDDTEFTGQLGFLPGYVIHLTTVLKVGEPELIFAPVTVEPWVWKGTFQPTSRQAGIFSADDFYALIETYQDNNSFWLGKYGYISKADKEKGIWTFQFNSGELKLEVDKIMGTMYPGVDKKGPNGETTTPPFKFDFRTRNQNYVMPNKQQRAMGLSATAQNTLYSIVTSERNVGVNTKSGQTFADLISAYQRNYWQQYIFGEFTYEFPAGPDEVQEPGPGTWTFKITEDVTLDYNNILAQMIPDPANYLSDFVFVIEPGVTVTIENYPATDGSTTTLTLTSENEEWRTLYNIVANRVPGIYSSEQFQTVMNIYGDGLDLEEYKAAGDGELVFPIWRDLTLVSELLQGGMKEKPEEPYSFSLQGHKIDLNQFDGTTYSNATADNLKLLVNLNNMEGFNSTQATFMRWIEDYNTYTGAAPELSSYGYYCFNPARWVFVLNDNLDLNRSEIEGAIKEVAGQLPFTIDLRMNGIYLFEDDGETYVTLSGKSGGEQLVKILKGETEEEEEDKTEP